MSCRGCPHLAMAGCVLMLGVWLLARPQHKADAIEGEVVRIAADAVSIAPAPGYAALLPGPRRFPIAPVLAGQLRAGDRVRAELLPGPDGARIGKIRFLRRAAPPPEPAMRADDGSLPLFAILPALAVPGIDGPFPLGAGQGTPTVLAFFFTSCGIPTACPLLSQKLRRLQGEIRGRGRIVTVTLDPDVDTLAALRGYAAAHEADRATWKLGRLEIAELEPLLRRVGVVRVRGDTQLLHSLHLTLLDGRGRILWRSDGNTWEVADLAGRIRALDEAGGRP